MARIIPVVGLNNIKYQIFITPIKFNARSYFRFHANPIFEEISTEKIVEIQKKLNLRKPVGIRQEQLTSNVVLRSVTYGTEGDLSVRPKNSVIFFPHYNSSAEYVNKICSVYHDYGLDVVTVMPKISHFFVPENGRSIIAEMVKKLSGNHLPLHVDKFLIHSNSSGAFFYALLADYLSSSTGAFSLNRIRGQVFDGLVLGNASSALKTYRSSLPDMFIIGADILKEKALDFVKDPFVTETLVFHSFDDQLCSSAEELVDNWQKQKKLDVNVSCWKRSVHGEHYSYHPVQYVRALESFLVKIGFV